MMGVVGLAMFGPLGLLLAAATALAVRGRRAADLTVYAGVALIAVSFGLILLGHARDRQPVGYGWTLRFEDSHWLALLGSVLLACGALWRPSATQVAPAVNEEGGARESS